MIHISENDSGPTKGFLASYLWKHTLRDVRRNKMHFCLSFLSIFIVVTGILVINTLIEHGPMIFLKLAEGEIG